MTKTLIIYYSNTGTIQGVSQQLADMTGADTYEIKPVKAYDKNMWTAWDVAKAERDRQQLPELQTPLPDLTPYDCIIIGTPAWGYTMANPVMTLLSLLDFQGKAVYGFWSFYDHDEQVEQDLRRLIQNGTYAGGLPLTQGILHNPSRLKQALADFTQKIK